MDIMCGICLKYSSKEATICSHCGTPLIIFNDPWTHRSKGMTCSTCIWFVEKKSISNTDTTERKKLGRCRKHAPTMNGYPAVFDNDWCGDHRIDENKI